MQNHTGREKNPGKEKTPDREKTPGWNKIPEKDETPGKRTPPGRLRLWWSLIGAILLTLGAGLLLLAVFPYQWLKPALDLLAADGSLEAFSASLHLRLRPPFAAASLLFFAAGGLWFIKAAASQGLVLRGSTALQAYSPLAELRRMARDVLSLETNTLALLSLGLLFAAGLALRWLYLHRPMQYDEAYTVVAFANRPFWKAIADYHLPNNHILHTLLVHFSIRWFGFNEWAARLPAMLAGALCIPAGYLVAKSLYARSAALLAAAWIAFSPVLVSFSANARGYTLLCLLTLVTLGLANYVRQRPNLIAWLLLSLTTALGFAALPTMLYPFGMIYGWLGLSWLARDVGAGYRNWRFPILLLSSAAAAGILSLLFYTPAMLNSGPQAIFANRHVVSLTWYEFSGNLLPKSINTWQFWTENWPYALTLIFALGLLSSVLLQRRMARFKIHLLLPAALWIALALVVQRVTPLPRIWLFLLPPLLILASAGLTGLGSLIASQLQPNARKGLLAAAVASLSLILISGTLRGDLSYRPDQPLYGPVSEAREIAPALLEQVQPSELIAANSPVQAPLRFRLLQLGAPESLFYDENTPQNFQKMIVVVERGADLARELYRLQLEGILDPASRISIAETPALIAYRMQRSP